MFDTLELLASAVIIGCGATLIMDVWGVVGWVAYYGIGIAFAAVLLGVWGTEWLRHPTLIPALIVGLGGVAAPFLIMQSAMGAGIAASRTPKPWPGRARSIVTHFIFGIGLYVSGVTRQALLSL